MATHCNTLQHPATHCNALQHIGTHCNTLPHIATHRNTQEFAKRDGRETCPTDCNTLQHTATLQHTTGWRRLIGSPKLHIIFHKRATKYRSLLRKMTYKDKGSCESSPPCTTHCNTLLNAEICKKRYGQIFTTGYNTLQYLQHCNTLQHTLQHTATHCNTP